MIRKRLRHIISLCLSTCFLTSFSLSQEVLYADVSLAPNASQNTSGVPYGAPKRDLTCLRDSSCYLNIHFAPYCYGTNLRLAGKPLRAEATVQAVVAVSESTGGKGNTTFKIQFPANLTFGSQQAVICDFVTALGAPELTSTVGATRTVKCTPPGDTVQHRYTMKEWMFSKSNEYAGSDQWRSYELSTLLASAILPTTLSADFQNINCMYVKDANANLINQAKMNCFYPTNSTDQTAKIKLLDDKDVAIPSNKATYSGTINNFKIKFLSQLPQVPLFEIVDGNVKAKETFIPKATVTFTQSGGTINGYSETGSSELQFIEELNLFDSSTGYKDLVLIYKFPGQNGFCGGFYSPLMIFLDDKRPQFSGVSNFPLYENIKYTYWPEKGAPGYFLVKKIDDNKTINSHEQFFGTKNDAQNGFEHLKEFDANKDDVIDSKDPIFKDLLLWNDKNGNSVAEKDEVFTLDQIGVKSISLKYGTGRPINFQDRAQIRESSTVELKNKKGKIVKGQIDDVWFGRHPRNEVP